MLASFGLMSGLACTPAATEQDVETTTSAVSVSTSPVRANISPPLSRLRPPPGILGSGEKKVIPIGIPHPVSSAASARSAAVSDPVRQTSAPSMGLLAPTPGTTFEGIGEGFTGPNGTWDVNLAPPDTNGAAGPNHYMQIVNVALAVFNKNGDTLLGPLPINELWRGFGGLCENFNSGDPTVNYDRFADRWVVAQFALDRVTPAFAQCVAVSTTGDPTGTYARYAFPHAEFPDYPKLGVWPDAYYITFNMFGAGGFGFVGPRICAVDRAKMLAGEPATQQCFNPSSAFHSFLAADLSGTTVPPAGAANPLLSLDPGNAALDLWKFHVDWVNPANSTFTGPTLLAVAPFTRTCAGFGCVPQPGTTNFIDSIGDRLMNRLEYRNFGDHEALVVNHSVSTGDAIGVRWYEVRNPSTTPTVFQQGTFAPDSTFRFMGSAAINRAGTIAIGYSASSSTVFPGLRFTGRLASDPPGVMQAEGVLFEGLASQTDGLTRWGDYSGLTVDPVDDCTFWYTNEYQAVNGSFNWHTRIGRFTVPPCDSGPPRVFSVSVSPSVFEGTTPATGTVLLTSPAPTGGATVTLASSNTALVTVPGSVLVPAGSQSATFPVTSVKTGTQTNVTLTATFPAGTSVTGTVTILASPIVATLSLSPAAVVGGTTSTGTVTLSGAAPTGGALITLASNNTSVATVPASFTIPAGATSGTFTVTTLPQTADTSVTISASFHNTTRSAVLTVHRTNTLQSLTLNPSTIEGSTTTTGTVTITDPAPAGGAVVALASNNTAVATVPASVTVPAGQLSVNFTVNTVQVANQTTVTITGTFPAGFSRSATLTVLRSPVPASVTVNPSAVTGGQPSTGTVTLSRAAPTGGSVVALASSNTAVATVPASITIPAGATSGTFTVTTFAQLTDTAVDISASLNGLTRSGTLLVGSPPGNATFDPALGAPRCATAGSACDTGGSIVRGRDNIINGIEPNQPNTLQGSCADGTFGFFHSDESIDRLRISTVDGFTFAPGKVVNVEAVVWVFSPSDVLDIFFAPDANNPSWAFKGSVNTTGFQVLETLSTTFTLPGGPLPAIRAQWRFVGSPEPCDPSGFNDRDDLVFAFNTDFTPPSLTITSPVSGNAVRGTIPVNVNASDNQSITRVELLVDQVLRGTDTSAPYSFSLDTTTLSAGVHSLQARAIDPAGNVGFSPGVSVTVDNVAPTVAITSPASGATVVGNVTITANASDATSGVASVSFFVDGSLIGTDPNSPYSIVWNTANVTPGNHTLQARALDRAGNQGVSANVTVIVPPGACVGLCSSPTIFTINGSFQSGPLGTGARCFQTTSVVHSGFCQNFVSPRTLSVNGTVEPCNGSNWPSVPAARNGGYCIQATAGNQSTASFQVF